MRRIAGSWAIFVLGIVACASPPKAKAPLREEPLVLAPDVVDGGAAIAGGDPTEDDRAVIAHPDASDARYYHGFWEVSQDEAVQADAGVLDYLRGERPEIADQLPGYVAQIFGIHADPGEGPKLIHFNFFCKREIENERKMGETYPDFAKMADWQHHVQIVHDGGPCFFQLDFDPASGTYENLTVNGQA